MGAKPQVSVIKSLMPSARSRASIAKRLLAQSGQMSTALIVQMELRHPWYSQLSAEERSWVGLVARAGISGFIEWFSAADGSELHPEGIFNVAPRSLTRKVTLNQTVDLIRTTIDVVEDQIGQLMPRGDQPILQNAILHYSREIAFASAKVYARAAESRGKWDQRIEALIVDAVVRADSNESLLSRASALGWHAQAPVLVAVGNAPGDDDFADLRNHAESLGLVTMAALHGDRLVVLLSPVLTADDPVELDEQAPIEWLEALSDHFGSGPIVIGPLVSGLSKACKSARAALSGARCAKGWPEGPRVLTAHDLLPERVLAGNGQARRELVEAVFMPLMSAGGDLLETCVCFADQSGSVEATARCLFVHPNTVRYRLKRIAEVTGYSPSSSREAYVLRLAITLGRQQTK